MKRLKVAVSLICTLCLLGIIPPMIANSSSSSVLWSFQNNSFLSFNDAENFSGYPNQNITYDSSLLGYWKMDEGTGLTVSDSIGRNSTGTLLNCTNGIITKAERVAGISGNALYFNGSSSVNLGNSSSLSPSYFSISAFFSINTTGIVQTVAGRYLDDNNRWELYINAANHLKFIVGNGSAYSVLDSNITLSKGTWYSAVGTFDGSSVKLYVNATLATKQSLSGSMSKCGNSSARIGLSQAFNFYGIVDEVRIYNVALNQSEVTGLYNHLRIERGLIGEWLLDESSGSIAYDSHLWITGKFGNATNFDGVKNLIQVSNDNRLDISSAWSISFWINPTNASQQVILSKRASGIGWIIGTDSTGGLRVFTTEWSSPSTMVVTTGSWQYWAISFNGSVITYYKNGVTAGYAPLVGNCLPKTNASLQLGACSDESLYFTGAIDEFKIYNRSISFTEAVALYKMGPYAQPDPVVFADYYNFTSADSNVILLISVNASAAPTLVNCTNFFKDNMLIFRTNGTVSINLWSTLGAPTLLTNAVWNTQNYTVTLTLNSTSLGKIDWNPIAPPSASGISTTTTNAASSTIFSVLWQDKINLFDGGYIFSTNNTGAWMNSSWIPFVSNPDRCNTTLILNNTIGSTIAFREYANNTLGVWGDSGIYMITTTAPAPSVTIEPIASPTAIPTSSPNSTWSPTVTPSFSLIPDGITKYPNELAFIIIAIILFFLVSFLALAFKKGLITVSIVNENSGSEGSEEC